MSFEALNYYKGLTALSKDKSLTLPHLKPVSMKRGLRTADCGLRTRTADRVKNVDQVQNEDCGLGMKQRLSFQQWSMNKTNFVLAQMQILKRALGTLIPCQNIAEF